MLSVKLDTGFNIEVHFPISPFHRRMFAWVLDVVIMSVYGLLISKLINSFPENKSGEKEWLWVLAGIPVLIYYPVMEALTSGQTVGKMLLGIRIITLEGGQATLSQYILRWLFRTVDFPVWIFAAIFTGALPWYCSILTFSGIASVMITDKSQRIGDIIAGTIVIFTRSKTSWEDTVFTELEDGYKPLYPEVMKLSDKDLNSLKGIIGVVKKKNAPDIAFRIAERIKGKLNIQSDQESLEFLETLLKDYNYFTAS